MNNLDTYGIRDHELEPVGQDFDGVIYYTQDDVDEEISRLHASLDKSMAQTDEVISMLKGIEGYIG